MLAEQICLGSSIYASLPHRSASSKITMNTLSTLSPAFDSLILSEGSVTERIAKTLRWLTDCPPNELSSRQKELCKALPLPMIRSFGKAEVLNYVEVLDHQKRYEIIDTIIRMRHDELDD